MVDNEIIDILNATVLTEAQFNREICQSYFDNGVENIYLVDEMGRYRWRFLWRKDFVSQIGNDKGNFVFRESKPILFDLPIIEKNSAILLEYVEDAFSHNECEIIEIPILKSDGKVIAVAKKRVSMSLYEQNALLLSEYEYFYHDIELTEPIAAKESKPMQSRIKDFLAQIESDRPILLVDAYDIEELEWMCTKLRSSEKYGSENRLYLQYSSWDDFRVKMTILDWKTCLKTKKIVFLFSNKDKIKRYDSVKLNDGLREPIRLSVDEIQEVINSYPRGFSGSDFFNMILDSHPLLLTIGWHGLPTYTAVWKVFCENKTVSKAIEHMKNPASKEESNLLDANLSHMLKYRYKERIAPFFACLTKYLDSDRKYGIADWFKAFYLSVNDIIGRRFGQRIAPAIFYDEHGVNQGQVLQDFGFTWEDLQVMKKEVIKGFKLNKFVGVVRAPLSRLGCQTNNLIWSGQTTEYWRTSPLGALKLYANGQPYGLYSEQSDKRWMVSKLFRFEDLKLYPWETINKLCDFLRLPWSEMCMRLTTNGDDSGIVDGTAGFDVKPVYNKHLEFLSILDYYRIELLNYNSYKIWGYKPCYYDGSKYTPEELKLLFDIPFKIEKQDLSARWPDKWPNWPDAKAIKEFHDWIYQRALDVMEHGEEAPHDKNGNPMRLVEVAFPDLNEGQSLFESW